MTVRAPSAASSALGAAERRLQEAMVAGDVDALDELLDDDVVYTGPDGVRLGKAEDLDAHRSGLLDVQTFEPESVTVRLVGDAGVTLVDAILRGRAGGQPFTARMRYTRMWIETGGAWRVVAAHASELSDGTQQT